MGQTSSAHKSSQAEALQLESLVSFREPVRSLQSPKVPPKSDIEFEKSRNIHEINKAVDFLAGHLLLNVMTKDNLSNFNTNSLICLDGETFSDLSLKSAANSSRLNSPKPSEITNEYLAKGFRKLVTHTQLTSALIDGVFDQHAQNMFKRFSFADQKKQFNIQSSRFSKSPTAMSHNLDSLKERRTSKWLTRTSSQENTSGKMRDEVEKLKEFLEKTGQLSEKKRRMSRLEESPDMNRKDSPNTSRNQSQIVAEEGNRKEVKSSPQKQNLNQPKGSEEKKTSTKRNTSRNASASKSPSRAQTKSQGPETRNKSGSRKVFGDNAKEIMGPKCSRAVKKENIPVVYKNIQVSSNGPKSPTPTYQRNVVRKETPKRNVQAAKPNGAPIAKSRQVNAPRSPTAAVTKSQANMKKYDLSKSYRTQGEESFDNNRMNESARTTPLNNYSAYEDVDINPINVDLDLNDLIQQSRFVGPYQNNNQNEVENNLYYSENISSSQKDHDHSQPYTLKNNHPNALMYHNSGMDLRASPNPSNQAAQYESHVPNVQYDLTKNHSQYFSPPPGYSSSHPVLIQNQSAMYDPRFDGNNNVMQYNEQAHNQQPNYYSQEIKSKWK